MTDIVYSRSRFDRQPNWLHWLDRCSSTNTWALEKTTQLQHGDVVFTRHQTAGRGQHRRVWHSPPGVLTASFVLDCLAPQLAGLSLVAGLAVIYAVEDLLPALQGTLRLKWSNDVWLHDRKLAGILSEATAQPNATSTRVIVGIGLNRCVEFAQAGLDATAVGQAISLHQASSSVPDELSLLERLRHYLLQAVALQPNASTSGLAALLPDLRRRDALLDRRITLEFLGERISGRAAGIDENGRLLLRSDATLRAFSSGHIISVEL